MRIIQYFPSTTEKHACTLAQPSRAGSSDDAKVSRERLAFAEAYGYRENVIQILHSSPGQSVQNTYQFRTNTVQTDPARTIQNRSCKWQWIEILRSGTNVSSPSPAVRLLCPLRPFVPVAM